MSEKKNTGTEKKRPGRTIVTPEPRKTGNKEQTPLQFLSKIPTIDSTNMSKEQGKKTEGTMKYSLDRDLEDLLREVFGISKEDDNHEIIQSLAYDGITSWKRFRRLQPEAIEELTKEANRGRVSISKSTRMELNIMIQYIGTKLETKGTKAREINNFDPDDFELFLENHNKEKREKSIQRTMTPQDTLPHNPRGKSRTEKALDNWDKKKLEKTNFDILREDSKYRTWRESFMAEIKVQGLTRMVDDTFSKKTLKDEFDRELYEKQSDYFWTVLLYALKNPIAEMILGKHRNTSDARTAFLAVDDTMKGSVAQMYNISDLSDKLRELNLSSHSGNRAEFLSKWFETLRQLNTTAEKEDKLSFVHVRSMLQNAVSTDADLTRAFSSMPKPVDKSLQINTLMEHMLEQAMLLDGMKNSNDLTGKKHLTALLHQLGIEEDVDYLIHKARRGPSDDIKLPDTIYHAFSRDDKIAWRQLSDDAKRAIVHLCLKGQHATTLQPSNETRNAYVHGQGPIHGEPLYTPDPSRIAFDTVNALKHSLAAAEANLRRYHDVEHSTDFTAMSSISSKSRPPSTKATVSENKTDAAKLPTTDRNTETKAKFGPGNPATVMASMAETYQINPGQQHSNLDYFGTATTQINQHHLFYNEIEQQRDRDTTQHVVSYEISKRNTRRNTTAALIDRGANGCVAGDDCVWIGGPTVARKVHITGMDNHQVRDIKVGTVGAYADSNRGPVICIFNETAYTGRGQSIISALQLENYRNRVDDRALELGGGQQITTADGYTFPLSIVNGLPYLNMRPYTRTEYNQLPHVIMTSEQIWDPRTYDNSVDPSSESFKHANPENKHLLPHDDYDIKGEYIGMMTDERTELNCTFWLHEREYQRNESIARCIQEAVNYHEMKEESCEIEVHESNIHASHLPRTHAPNETDYENLKPYFAWIPTKMIRKTFRNSTQYGFTPNSPEGNLFKRWSSPNPAMNVFRLQDDILTDKIHSHTPAIDGGFKEAQIFFGRRSHIIHPEPISRSKTFLRCLQNFVRKWGAPLRILADHAQYHASFQVLDYLRMLWIRLWFSEAYYQHQNPFERRYQTFKRIVNRTMDRTNTPPELWYLCICHVAYILNRVSDPSLSDRQPIHVATGSIADISSLTTFQWMEPVYYKIDNKQRSFPDTGEGLGYFVGVAENVGHAMTYKIWTKDTKQIIERSSVRSAWDQRFTNQRANGTIEHDNMINIPPLSTSQKNGEITKRPTDFIYSQSNDTHRYGRTTPDAEDYGEPAYLLDQNDEADNDAINKSTIQYAEDGSPMVILTDENGNPKLDTYGNAILIPGKTSEELQGITFKYRQDDGTTLRARVIGPDISRTRSQHGNQIAAKFRVKFDTTQREDTIAYNDIMNFLHRDQIEEEGTVWRFRRVLAHRELNHHDPKYRNCGTNVSIEWENGEITEEPLNIMIQSDPIPMAQYALDHNLLEMKGWKSLKRITKRRKLFQRLVKQVKLRSYRTAPKYMYGYQVPRDYTEAMKLDDANGNDRWASATALEMGQLHDYSVFIDKGKYSGVIPIGFKKIRVHLVFAVKHDGRHKARLVADGHLTDTPLDSVYAGVVSIRGLRICIFLAELNGMEAYATDIGNAYLEAVTQEKVCIVAGPEFGELEGHLLIVYKALYGLRSSGKQFGDLLAACLKELGFKQSYAEPQIFMRENQQRYEYIATYVDDLCLVMNNPMEFLNTLQSKPYSFKLKGSGPMSFHLGCGFLRDEHGTLCMDPSKYINKILQSYEQMFGSKPGTKPKSPLEEGDHPELDTSEFLDDDDTLKYQSLIGSLQWLITLGRWDIQTAVMSLSSFRSRPRKGHLQRVKRICAYVNRFKHYVIRFRTDEPDLSQLDSASKYDWSKDVYENFREEISADIPKPLGKKVTLIHWFDANLMHDVLSGKAVTGCIHFANKTPIMWYSKKQATTETATFGAEFCAGRTCIEQIVDLRNTFRYLGVPVHDISYVFGDNKSMIDSATYPYARLNKRHNILSFHYVRSMIARGFISLTHVNSEDNLADIVTKHWGYKSVKQLVETVFYHKGNIRKEYVIDDT